MNASVRMNAAVIAIVLTMKFALTIQTVRLDVASIAIATKTVPMAKSATAAQANAFLWTRHANAIVLRHTRATRTTIVNASVFMTAVATMIVTVRIKCVRVTIPACLCKRILLRGLLVMTVFRHTLAMIIVNVSVSMNAAKMTIVLVRIKRARATISASLYLRILLPVNTNAAAIVIAQMKRNA